MQQKTALSAKKSAESNPKTVKTAPTAKVKAAKATKTAKSQPAKTKNQSVRAKNPKTTRREAKKIKDMKKNAHDAAAKTATAKVPSRCGKIFMASAVSVALVASLASLGYCIWDYFDDQNTAVAQIGSTREVTFVAGSIAEVVDQVAPAVVSILTETRTTGFYGQTSTSTTAGTGMIVSADGYVVTNKHVIEGANTIQVVLDDGTTYKRVELIGTDPLNDVAFLKVQDVSDLPTVTLGDSKTITAGQQVIAIGNALGQFQNTITSGIISGTGRSITAADNNGFQTETLTDMLQTDAAINAGNSGGPLVNAAGEVIGINTATSSEADGIGFAIPISSIKGLLKSVIEHGVAERAYLGVYYVTINADVASTYNLPVTSGAYIYAPELYSAVINNGPAAQAGIKDKDIITKINGVEVGKSGTVGSLIGEYAPNDKIKITVLRDGKEVTLDLVVGKYTGE